MKDIKLTEEEVQNLLAMIDTSMIRGAAVEQIVTLKKKLLNALKPAEEKPEPKK